MIDCPYCGDTDNIDVHGECRNGKHSFAYAEPDLWYFVVYKYKMDMIGCYQGRYYICNSYDADNDITLPPFKVDEAYDLLIRFNNLNCFI
jgi:hypothetical protein